MILIDNESLQKIIEEYTKKLSGPVYIDRLFTPEFIMAHSNYKSAEELFALAGINDHITFSTWVNDDPDRLIRKETDFESWELMLQTAGLALILKRQELLQNGESTLGEPTNASPFYQIAIGIEFRFL